MGFTLLLLLNMIYIFFLDLEDFRNIMHQVSCAGYFALFMERRIRQVEIYKLSQYISVFTLVYLGCSLSIQNYWDIVCCHYFKFHSITII